MDSASQSSFLNKSTVICKGNDKGVYVSAGTPIFNNNTTTVGIGASYGGSWSGQGNSTIGASVTWHF
jgi:hypothetical protein